MHPPGPELSLEIRVDTRFRTVDQSYPRGTSCRVVSRVRRTSLSASRNAKHVLGPPSSPPHLSIFKTINVRPFNSVPYICLVSVASVTRIGVNKGGACSSPENDQPDRFRGREGGVGGDALARGCVYGFHGKSSAFSKREGRALLLRNGIVRECLLRCHGRTADNEAGSAGPRIPPNGITRALIMAQSIRSLMRLIRMRKRNPRT